MNLTRRQLDTLDFIKAYIAENRIAPTFLEIAGHLGVTSKNSVHRIMAGLEARGKIRRMKGHARAIEVIE